MEPFEQHLAGAQSSRSSDDGPARILIAAGDDHWQPHLLDLLMQQNYTCRRAHTIAEAERMLKAESFDLVLAAAEFVDGDVFALLHDPQESPDQDRRSVKTIVLDRSSAVHTAVRALRCGAVDFLHVPVKDDEFIERIEVALRRSRVDQQREKRLARLKQICRQLNIARKDISEQVDLLCHDLVNAYSDMNEQLNEVAMASEFRTLLRQELDIEDLLRTALEYLLTKTGPTNAAVFLPDGDGTFNLGAYVNYDCPRETINYVLDKLGDAICPQMEQEDEIITFDDAMDFAEWIGVDAGMLGESQIIGFSCRHEHECLAVVVFFRTHTEPFNSDMSALIETLRPIFAQQLANIIHVHHRAKPDWPEEAQGDEMDFDDEFGFGCGGRAA